MLDSPHPMMFSQVSSSLRMFLCALALVASLTASAQQTAQPTKQDAAPPAAQDAGAVFAQKPAEQTPGSPAPAAYGAVRMGPGDLLDISVFGVPDLSQKARITSSGDVYLPLVGYVHLDGLTIPEAQTAIEQRLVEGRFVNEPHVTIFVAEYATGVSVMGEVQKPGIYPIFGSRRLFDLISAAGGLTERAGRVVTITHRDRPLEPQSVSFDPDPAKNSASNVEIVQGDTILVTRAGVIYVVGEVQQPSGYLMEASQNFTVLKALALAHGPGRYAKLDNSKVIRKKADGSYEEIPVALRKILDAKQKDVPLQADDILFVPASGGKRAAEQTLSSVLGIASGLAIRIP
ncbi:MAG TPA: polysaccharide biosynthesis/export family protein [Terriglobales bacterium]|nr:polysaccharide biosynthesis/export family protein [Terriglobales bacterium]